ncbi:tetratricopeptide repeat protein [Sphingomonas humi]|uniref:tetratricopeptide repeat protein n=1 Tax=Sphingomonas humi TaxID=335630 RepID=UPI0031DC9806
MGKLVSADDSNPDYWIELGKLSMQLADYGTAYDAYQRAHELDRGNADVLAVMTQLALRSGNLEIADDNAKQLELLAPNNPAVSLTKGYIALRRGNYEEANRQVAAFATVAPYDSSGKVLQARILMSQNQPKAAVDLLEGQVKQQPSDATSLKALSGIYELLDRWGDSARTLQAYLTWRPEDQQARVNLVEAALRSGQVDAAAAVTLKAVQKDDVDQVLAPWISFGKQEIVADRLFEYARGADYGRRIAIARFLATTAQPERVIALTEGAAATPVRPDNVIPNALYGEAIARSGRTAEGMDRLNRVIEVDGANREALRARALLRSAAGLHQKAIEDAQKMVTLDPDSANARLLLARIYDAGGDADGARRTLWDAFHDIGEDQVIYDALKAVVARTEGADGVGRLSKEYYDKRLQQLARSFS